MKFLSSPDQGFTVLYASLLAALVLAVAASFSSTAIRETRLATFSGGSQTAQYSAESGFECALYHAVANDAFVEGSGTTELTCAGNTFDVFEYPDFWEFQFPFSPRDGFVEVEIDTSTSPSQPNPIITAYGYNQNPFNDGTVIQRVVSHEYPPQGLIVSCDGAPDPATTGETVTWTADASGGDGNYSYEWTFSPATPGYARSMATGNPVTNQYSSEGTKGAEVTVTDGTGQTADAECEVVVGDDGGGDGGSNETHSILTWFNPPRTVEAELFCEGVADPNNNTRCYDYVTETQNDTLSQMDLDTNTAFSPPLPDGSQIVVEATLHAEALSQALDPDAARSAASTVYISFSGGGTPQTGTLSASRQGCDEADPDACQGNQDKAETPTFTFDDLSGVSGMNLCTRQKKNGSGPA